MSQNGAKTSYNEAWLQPIKLFKKTAQSIATWFDLCIKWNEMIGVLGHDSAL